MPIFEPTRSGRAFSRVAPVLGLVVALASCMGSEAPEQVQVTSDLVTITGPRGFCIEPSATRDEGDSGFVILGNCAAISGSLRAPQPDIPALLTAAISAPSEGARLTDDLEELETFLRSDDGRRLLSREGDAETVEILQTRVEGPLFLLQARDSSAGGLPGVASDYWRAYFEIGPRLATLSVLALADQEVSDAAALEVLLAFSARVSAANPGQAAPLPIDDGPQTTPQPSDGLLANLFR